MSTSSTSQPLLPRGARKLIYGTPFVRVCLLQVAPQQVFSEIPEHDRDWLLIQGRLERRSIMDERVGLAEGMILKSGQPYRNAKGQCYQLTNLGNESVEILELEWGTLSDASLPLGEVTEERPWGSFTVLDDQPHYKLKQLMVYPGSRLSLQRHQKREEHWFVVAGQPEVTINEQVLTPSVGAYIKIPLHAWHRLANPKHPHASGSVEIIELQLGEYFGEDDIERREDDYGRV